MSVRALIIMAIIPAALATGLLSTGSRAASEVDLAFADEFDLGPLAPAWSFEDAAGGSAYSIDGGNLILNVAATGTSPGPRVLKSELAAPYSVETQVAWSSQPGPATAGLVVYRDAGNWLLAGWDGAGRLELRGYLNGAPTGLLGVSDSRLAWLRLRKAKNNPFNGFFSYYFDASADGVNWTNVNVYHDSLGLLHSPNTRVGFLANSGGAQGYGIAFSHFREYGEDRLPSALLDYPIVPATTKIAQLTGPASNLNGPSSGQAEVCGTDLGIPFRWREATYLVFGDTFGCSERAYRPNVLARSTDTTPADGLLIADWVTDPTARARPVVPTTMGRATIPTGAFASGASAFVFFMEIMSWDEPVGSWSCAFTSIASANAGDPTAWTNHQDTIGWRPGGFSQLAVLRDPTTPGLLYVYGTPCGRYGSVKLMRVPEAQVLDKSAYSYLAGFSGWNEPLWSASESDAITVAGGPAGELSVRYNGWLGRYTMTYLDETKRSIVMRESPSPWGPWGAPIVIARDSEFPKLYGAFMYEGFEESGGREVYFTMSQWDPYNVFLMKTTLYQR